MLLIILSVLLSTVGMVYMYIAKDYDFWKRKGVPYIKPKFPLGLAHNQMFGGSTFGEFHGQLYSKYKSQGLKYVGGFFMQSPALIVIDPELIKQILIKDFHHWESRELIPRTHEHISKNLFALDGQPWKEMRGKMTAVFTSGKMKHMFLLMQKCCEQLQEQIDNVILQNGTNSFKVKDLISRLTIDIIATCAFGLEVNSIKDQENEFYEIAQLIFRPNRKNVAVFLSHKNFPRISRWMRLNFYDYKVSNFLTNVIKDTIDYRKQQNVTRNDLIDTLTKAPDNKALGNINEGTTEIQQGKSEPLQNNEQESGTGYRQFTLEEITAQAFVFFAAGFDTASSTTSFCLYELAKSPEIQETLRREIDEVLANYDGKVTYQAIQNMPYLEQVVNETMRMYPSLPVLVRVCTSPCNLEGLELKPGMRAHIPLHGIHHDPEYYPDPYRFDPGRFTEDQIKNRHPLSFMPFGLGPRNCIGLRLGKLQIKMGLVTILSKFQLFPAPDTPSRIELDPFILFTASKRPFSLSIARRTDL